MKDQKVPYHNMVVDSLHEYLKNPHKQMLMHTTYIWQESYIYIYESQI